MGNCCSAPPTSGHPLEAADGPYTPSSSSSAALTHQVHLQHIPGGHVTGPVGHMIQEDMIDGPFPAEPERLEHMADREGMWVWFGAWLWNVWAWLGTVG